MKKVYIIKGRGGKPEHGWYQWLAEELKRKGFQVFLPQMPNTDMPTINEWVGALRSIAPTPDEETYFVGHSIGCQTILRYLVTLPPETKLNNVILVAPWVSLDEKTMAEEPGSIPIARPWIETPIDFDKAKLHPKKFICLFSDNDTYVPPDNQKFFQEKLSAEIIIDKGKGHFDKDSGIKELPGILSFFN